MRIILIATSVVIAAGVTVWVGLDRPTETTASTDRTATSGDGALPVGTAASNRPTQRNPRDNTTVGRDAVPAASSVASSNANAAGVASSESVVDAPDGMTAQQRATYQRLRRELRPGRPSPDRCADWEADLRRLLKTLEPESSPWLRVVKARSDCLIVQERPADAQAFVQGLLARFPDSVPLRNQLASVFLNDGDPEGAWIVLQEALGLGADARTHSLIAAVQEGRALDARIQGTPPENLARLQVAEASLRELIATQAPVPALVNRKRLVRNLSLQGRHQEAISEANAARAELQRLASEERIQAPNLEADLIYALAEAHDLAGNDALASAWFDQVLQQPMDDARRRHYERAWERRHHLRQAMQDAHGG